MSTTDPAPTETETSETTEGPLPTAIHFGADDLPFVDIGDGSKLKVIQVDVAQELWIVENIFQAGYVEGERIGGNVGAPRSLDPLARPDKHVVGAKEPPGRFGQAPANPRGYVVQKHRHTGPVYAYTTSGAWKYQEYDDVNRAGSFLFEPTGSTHTLECLENDTHVWFQMYGQNLNLDADGNVESVFDGPGTLEGYYLLAEAEGLPRPNVLVS